MKRKFQAIIYGAYGYTGELIVEECLAKGLDIIIAGRNAKKIETQGKQWNLPFRAVSLEDEAALHDLLLQAPIVINAAGPFVNTALTMIEACLKSKTHYLDINGDVKVFESIKAYGEKAKVAEIMLMPGVGFDVVPTDCMALALKKAMPEAEFLKIAFVTVGGDVSHGTATTVNGRLGEGALKRKNGELVKTTFGGDGFWIDFGDKKRFVINIPWGDLSTAYVSTAIPNIETYIGATPKVFYFLKFQFLYNGILRKKWMRDRIQKKIDQRSPGPDAESRSKASTLVWAEVKNKSGKALSMKLRTPDGYTLTALASVLISRKILSGTFECGFKTPAMVYSENLIYELPGVVKL